MTADPSASHEPADASAVDLTACDREPIHVPGSIQPHGLLLIARAATLEVVAGAGAIEERLAPDWQGRPLGELLHQDVAALLAGPAPGPGGTVLGAPVSGFEVALHRSGDLVLAELEPPPEQVRGASATLGWLDATATAFERAGTLQQLCERAAAAFRTLTGFDRVMIYRFLDDDAGRVVAEDRDPALATFLHHHFPATDIPRQARALYVRNRTRAIPDAAYQPAPIRPAALRDTDLSDVAIRSVSPIHLQYLHNMGVEASASVSIVKDGVLWGLIACHHHSPRHMPRDVRAIAAALAGGLARQVRAKEEAEEYRERLQLRGEEDALRPLLMRAGDLAGAVAKRGEQLRTMLSADGFACVDARGVQRIGHCPPEEALLALVDRLKGRRDAAPFATRQLAAEWDGAASFGTTTGVLAVTMPDAAGGAGATLMWLRAEQVEEIEWAGNPHKAVPLDSDATLAPRASFATWVETVRGRSRRWTLEQVEGAGRLARLLREATAVAEQRRLNAELSRANAAKDEALSQKDVLMREVDHRVQNSLQLVASFLSLQARDAPPAVADQLVEARSRLSAVAQVHRRLYRDDQIETIDLSRYLADLLEDMRASLGDGWARQITLDLAPVLIPTDRAVNVGLIAVELVINATKYAYPAGQPGPIDVLLEQHRNRLRLVVADHGRGKSGDGTGFGSRMMGAVVQRLGGTVEQLDNAPGLRAVLTAPIEGD